ncbi:hypothetical protein ABGV40_14965 [Paenibacillus amylolyticus]|uniref:hypothetical protein n=1 Tax=Paenibacillus amylolyticus TaxID=1451 RepID=UPI003241D0EA
MTTKVKEQIEKPEEDSKPAELKTCFIVMPISNADGYDPGHFNRVYDYIIKPACAAAGFKPSRADDTKHTNTIILDILDQIVKADMVLCDLSSKNPNVMYELGIRQAFNLPVVLIKDNATPRVFDTSALRDIEYDQTLRIDNVNTVVTRLTEALKETYRRKDDDTHSLISLLNIQPATLPEKKEISPDTALILDALKSMQVNLSSKNRNVKSVLQKAAENISESERILKLEMAFDEVLDRKVEVRHRSYGIGEVLGFDSQIVSVLMGDDQLVSFNYPYDGLYLVER